VGDRRSDIVDHTLEGCGALESGQAFGEEVVHRAFDIEHRWDIGDTLYLRIFEKGGASDLELI
jgi:hypothetical protein